MRPGGRFPAGGEISVSVVYDTVSKDLYKHCVWELWTIYRFVFICT